MRAAVLILLLLSGCAPEKPPEAEPAPPAEVLFEHPSEARALYGGVKAVPLWAEE